jgi:hypothetical protein
MANASIAGLPPLAAGDVDIRVGPSVGIRFLSNDGTTVLGSISNAGVWSMLGVLPSAQFSTINVAGPATLSVGNITGAQQVSLTSTNAAPGTLTTRTATQMFADVPNAVAGLAYRLRITNSGAGTLTLGAGTGVTLTGTMTVPTNTFRDFIVTFTSSSALVIQADGTGTMS